MTDCAECRRLERQLKLAALEHLQLNSRYGAENEVIKAAKRNEDLVRERFNKHKASHGIARGTSAS